MFKTSGNKKKRLVIIQCDCGHLNGDLIAYARYRICDLRLKSDPGQITHVLFVIHLPRLFAKSYSFVGFQGDPWISYHIDDLRPSTSNADFGLAFSKLFIGTSKVSALIAHEDSPIPSSEDYSEGLFFDLFPARRVEGSGFRVPQNRHGAVVSSKGFEGLGLKV